MSYHLDDGQILLPPQVFLDLRSTGGQAIIQIHQDVDHRIHVCTKECCKYKKNNINYTVKSGPDCPFFH